ncbi:hypothetical protein [uncultured Salinicola sp.]|uniref:hypothetical protein n=1 Tax=uncultured Salinicola sp. TaxID=1193542 RepID=UPI0026345BD8|nr:hypothetical protein [uncultured Salinicola sp.]|tara:strand:+ start:7868 stop:8311 length:444 start_codon:yes stop_codon:yes gene_type:complete
MEKTVNPKLPETIAEALADVLANAEPVGSRVTCDPAPTDTDEDWLVLVREVPVEKLQEAGFSQEGSPEFYTGNDAGGFRSWRKGEINLITTQSDEFFRLFLTATYLAKRFNLLRKQDRIALFQAVLYGVEVHNLEPEPWGAARKQAA